MKFWAAEIWTIRLQCGGKDELALLASGMDNMRKALKESNEKEAELMLANRRMITETRDLV